MQGSPTPSIGPQAVRNRAAQQEVSGGPASEASSVSPHRSHYHLNHTPSPHPPTPPPPPSVEKLSSTKLVPGAKKVGDHWVSVFLRDSLTLKT